MNAEVRAGLSDRLLSLPGNWVGCYWLRVLHKAAQMSTGATRSMALCTVQNEELGVGTRFEYVGVGSDASESATMDNLEDSPPHPHWLCYSRAMEWIDMQCVFCVHNGESWQGLQLRKRIELQNHLTPVSYTLLFLLNKVNLIDPQG